MNVLQKLSGILLYFLIWLQAVQQTENSMVKFTNLICKSYDESFVKFEKCFVKAINRSCNTISVRASLRQAPVENLTIRLYFKRKENGWKPFLYDASINDGCKYLRTRSGGHPIYKISLGILKNYSSFMEGCPYDKYFEIDNLPNTAVMYGLRLLPLPNGEYGVYISMLLNGLYRITIDIFGVFT